MASVPQHDSRQTGEILVARKIAGRERPWRPKRLGAERVADAFRALGQIGKAARCRECGTVLTFQECPVDGQKRLQKANFCRERLCPMCAWRRSLKWAAEAALVLHQAALEQPRWGWVMLTLTQRNVPGEALPGEVDRVLKGWDSLRRRQEFQAVAGWLRVLEVTHKDAADTWHPHIHALLWVRPAYWTHGYVSQARWRQVWADVLGLNYDPVVDVHRVKARRNGDPLGAAAREVGKYAVKDADLLGRDAAEDVERIRVLDAALKGRRLLTWGGELRRIARQVAPTVPEGEEDLVHVAEEDHGPQCPVCGTEMREHVYRWVEAVRQYVG